jgi:streptogramin lyase
MRPRGVAVVVQRTSREGIAVIVLSFFSTASVQAVNVQIPRETARYNVGRRCTQRASEAVMRFALFAVLVPVFPLALSAGTMDTVAGTGKAGYAGDGGPATAASLNQPFHCDLAGKGLLYIAEAGNHCVRLVDLGTGRISTVAGTGKKGYTGDGGLATKATLNEPYAVTVAPNGDFYIVDRLNAVVRKVEAKTGLITTAAGNGKKGYAGDGGKATEAMLVEPNDCCLDGKGGLLIADVGDWRVRRLDLGSGSITTFAGTGRPKEKVERTAIGDGGPATRAVIVGARAVCVDGAGITYICEREGNAIRKVDAAGTITTFAGTGARGSADGPANRATFNGPKAIRCDRGGDVFVVDTESHSIRRIDVKALRVTTVAGGQKGSEGDGGDALKAGLDRPHGCVLDADGVLYIADSNNNRVRRVKP